MMFALLLSISVTQDLLVHKFDRDRSRAHHGKCSSTTCHSEDEISYQRSSDGTKNSFVLWH